MAGVSSVFSSTVSKTEEVGTRSPLDIIVNPKLQMIKRVATTAVAFVIKFPADLENIKFSWETPIPRAPPSDFCIKTSKTKIIAITHISNVTGAILPIKKIVDLAREKNIPVLVDGTQGAPHEKIDMQELGCDF